MKTYIIAEIGINHNGSLKKAKKLIALAALAGANAVKFQCYNTDEIVTVDSPKADYQKKNTNSKKSIYNLLKKCELSENDFRSLKKECKKFKVEFLSSVFDIQSLNLLNKIGLKKIKIPSGETNNYPLLKLIGKFSKKVILSTGMTTTKEISQCLKILIKNGIKKKNISILHCTTDYPANYKDLNLNAIHLLKKIFKLDVGYSDHSKGIEAAIAAVSLGAKIIEKHFTLNQNLPGPDHKASLNFREFKNMVSSIRNIEKSLGEEKKKISSAEIRNSKIVKKSIVASKNIKIGELFSENNITTKRPGYGLSPMKWEKIIGKKSKKNFKRDELIS